MSQQLTDRNYGSMIKHNYSRLEAIRIAKSVLGAIRLEAISTQFSPYPRHLGFVQFSEQLYSTIR